MQTMTAIKAREVYGTLPAVDIDRARRWYDKAFGWQPMLERDSGLMYEIGSSHMLLYPSQEAGSNRATAISIVVDDARQTAEQLRQNGVTLERYDLPNVRWEDGLARMDDMLGGWVKDSEGNVIAFAEFANR